MTRVDRAWLDQKPRVLCVDDEPHILSSLDTTLRRSFEVSTATNGPDALRLLDGGGPFAVLLSDYSMPGMTGAELLARARLVAPDTVRMLLTGQATIEGAIAAVNEGHVFRFLTKPCPPAAVIRALQDGVEQARLVTADRLLLERKVESMTSHLVRAERLASLGTMAGAVGHELSNALNVLTGTMSLVAEDAELGVLPTDETLRTLRTVQERLTVHVRHLLNFGRPSTDTAPSGDLTRAVGDVVDMLQLAGLLRRVRVALELPVSPVRVRIAQSALEQLLVNLVKNAVESFEEAPRAEPRIAIGLTCDRAAGSATLTITDNAFGIAPEKLPLVFEPYYTTKSADRGTGLGLFVVRHLVRGAGGEITVHSTPGHGSTFTFSLPLLETRDAVA